jgi:hypothetical protein
LWLLYLVISAVVAAAGILVGLRTAFAEGGLWRQVFGAIVSVLYLIPLYGYVQQKRITPRWLWWAVLVVAGTVIVAGIVVSGYFAVLTGDLVLSLGIFVIAASLAPNLFAIHQYVRNPRIWNAT